ncbi:glycosyltransferase [Methylobacterium sp. J-077]|uniref:glycosyltransferase n=1 Tax=Methylobacterium sp. J-077 TaxID=2836656 RepID=UPI001FB98FD3|nr:glycosyltransferase [Methylobacterium sp. J-077]MCJ2126408.1 glycosyltransferase [Methylobacterium sp. J-077]
MMINYLPKVTVAIPVYNGADYLRQAIESALNQTYKNLEIIVLDDGSTDDGRTYAIAKSFGPAIRYIHQENTGVAGAMNHIIDVMTGDVFTWLSHDDMHFPHKVQMQIEYFNIINDHDAIIFSDVHYFDSKDKKIDESRLNYQRYMSKPKWALLDSAINGCSLFIPAHILKEFGPFDLMLRFTQDYALWNEILTKYDFYHLPSPLIGYRIHAGQGTHQPAAVVEGDALWVMIAERRTETERMLLAGSTVSYFEQLATFLTRTPYKHAAVHAVKQARAACRATSATVLLQVTDDVDGCLFAAASVLRQTHRNLELLLISTLEAGETLQLSRWAAGDHRVKLISFPQAEAQEVLARGSLYASGAYVAFIDAESLYVERKLEMQIDYMQQHGLRLTWCATTSHAAGTEDRIATMPDCSSAAETEKRSCVQLSTLMIHRSLICSGEFEELMRESTNRGRIVKLPLNGSDEAGGALVVNLR